MVTEREVTGGGGVVAGCGGVVTRGVVGWSVMDPAH